MAVFNDLYEKLTLAKVHAIVGLGFKYAVQ